MVRLVIYYVPPIHTAKIKDFQSIKNGEVEFGDFTVLVGPSNSGKSAFFRAVRACLRNSFVPANVRSGATKSVVSVVLDDAEPITIERGKSLSAYVLGEERYTKTGKTVPEAVAKAIGMPLVEGADLNFTFQFDRPFLLAETGSQAAQVVGSLTNVTLLHEAVREANRRRSEANQRLKLRQADVERYLSQVPDYADLPDQKTQLVQATAELTWAEEQESNIKTLRALVTRIEQADAQLATLEVPEEPSELADSELSALAEKLQSLQSLRSLVQAIDSRADEIRAQVSQAQSLKTQAEKNEQEYERVLHELGACPTCGRSFQ